MCSENVNPIPKKRKYISDEKQITYIPTQNGIAIPVHLKFFRVYHSDIKLHYSQRHMIPYLQKGY